jgi:dihydrofolate synthase/folylpolyglutamate synthase
MDYKETLDFLYSRLPMFSRIGKAALKPDLENTLKLCAALGDPHKQFKSIHIAGTNGKGSTSHMLAAILQEAGYKTALYTSPHLNDFRERILINGVPVAKEFVVQFTQEHQGLIEAVKPSFFEITVAMAFAYFAQEKVDIAIIETGLGGRLDSTNIITPVLSVITNISYDHMDLLGDTLPAIAAEKAGIIKPKVPVVIGEIQAETERVFFEHSIRNNSTLYYAEANWDLVRVKQDAKRQYFKAINRARREIHKIQTDLLGSYQQYNIRTVLAALDVLAANQGMDISMAVVEKALTQVKALTGLRGRWECLQQKPLIIADVAHNEAGLKEVCKQWRLVPALQKHIIIGFVKDKDLSKALAQLPKDAQYYFTNANIPRALPAVELSTLAASEGLTGTSHPSTALAIEAAKQAMQPNDALLICGSFFIVGEALEALHLNQPSKQLGLFARG